MTTKLEARADTSIEAREVEQRQTPELTQYIELEPCLKVGTSATFQFDDIKHRGATRYSTIIRGWNKGRYIFLDRPTSVSFDIVSCINVAYIVRFVHVGSVVGFLANLRDEFQSATFPFFRCDWPREVQSLRMRKHRRVDVRLDCEVKVGSGDIWRATIMNLSCGGCKILCPERAIPKDLIHVTFSIQGNVTFTELASIVRNATSIDGKYSIGCQFCDPNDNLTTTIARFVATHSADKL